MRRGCVIAVVVLGVGLLALDFVPACAGHWDGYYDLTVRVDRPGGLPRSVVCAPISRREVAEELRDAYTRTDERPDISRSVEVDPFDGRPVALMVPAGYTYSPLFGRVVYRWQFKYLLVIGTLPDGRRVGAVVELPDYRQSREVTVTLP